MLMPQKSHSLPLLLETTLNFAFAFFPKERVICLSIVETLVKKITTVEDTRICHMGFESPVEQLCICEFERIMMLSVAYV